MSKIMIAIMVRNVIVLICFGVLTMLCFCNSEPSKINVLIVTGGHGFERDQFFAMWNSFPQIAYREAKHPNANNFYTPDSAVSYDVLVFYDMVQDITDDQKKAFLELLAGGKGVVFLHHSLASYQTWDEFENIVGGRYYLTPYEKDGKEIPASTFKHDVDLNVRVVDPAHPVTKGLKDFSIHDEAYGGFTVLPTVKELLTTDHAESGPIIGWTHRYGNSRIVTIQLGHDHYAYENPNYRQLLEQSVLWLGEWR